MASLKSITNFSERILILCEIYVPKSQLALDLRTARKFHMCETYGARIQANCDDKQAILPFCIKNCTGKIQNGSVQRYYTRKK